MRRPTTTRRTKSGATVQERVGRGGITRRKRTNADGSTRTSRRTAGGGVKSATRKTASGAVKSMMRGGKTHGKNSSRVAFRNTPGGKAAIAARRTKRQTTRRARR